MKRNILSVFSLHFAHTQSKRMFFNWHFGLCAKNVSKRHTQSFSSPIDLFLRIINRAIWKQYILEWFGRMVVVRCLFVCACVSGKFQMLHVCIMLIADQSTKQLFELGSNYFSSFFTSIFSSSMHKISHFMRSSLTTNRYFYPLGMNCVRR